MNRSAEEDRDELVRLLAETAQGGQQAFAELYRRSAPKLFGVCLHCCATAAMPKGLITLARNKAIDRLRQHREDLLDQPEAFDRADEDQPSPAQQAQQSQERQRLEHCLDGLEPEQKSAIREAFFSGATYNDLAARRGAPLGTMKSCIRRSLIRLKACLEIT